MYLSYAVLLNSGEKSGLKVSDDFVDKVDSVNLLFSACPDV